MWLKKDAAEQKEKPIQDLLVNYLGGHPDLKAGYAKLNFYENRIEFVRGKNIALAISADDVNTYGIEGKEDISRRITATRMVTLGIFALATPKKSVEREQYLTIILKNGSQLVFEFKNRFINEAVFRGMMATTFAKMLQHENRGGSGKV
jgi:hypothetical protein